MDEKHKKYGRKGFHVWTKRVSRMDVKGKSYGREKLYIFSFCHCIGGIPTIFRKQVWKYSREEKPLCSAMAS